MISKAIDAIAMRYDANDDEHYFLQDTNFNVTAVVDETGTVEERYAYTPYGEVTVLDADFSADADNESDISNEHLYTGRRLDPETGLQLNRNRFYASNIGRWVNRDPIEYLDGMNFYSYVAENPLYYTDPFGLSKVTVIIKIGGKISKVLKLSAQEAKKLLKRRTDDALKSKPDRKYTGEVFANMPDENSAKKLAEEISPCNEAVRHPKSPQGHPPHYHPVKSRSPNGRPKTGGTPHIGNEYDGSSPSLMLLYAAMEEGADIAIDLTPIIGDLRDVPELFNTLDDTIQITYNEAGRTVRLRNKDKARRTTNMCDNNKRCEKPLTAGSLLPGR